MTPLTPDVEVGFRVTGRVKTATPYLTRLFSGGWPRTEDWPAKNVHTDEEFARATGLSGRNASGAMMQGYLAELMVDTRHLDMCVGERERIPLTRNTCAH